MKISNPRALLKAILTLFGVLMGFICILYTAPFLSHEPTHSAIRRFFDREYSVWVDFFRILWTSTKNFFGRLTERERYLLTYSQSKYSSKFTWYLKKYGGPLLGALRGCIGIVKAISYALRLTFKLIGTAFMSTLHYIYRKYTTLCGFITSHFINFVVQLIKVFRAILDWPINRQLK